MMARLGNAIYVTTSLHGACIALTAMVASPTAQAADTTLTLACQGTTTISTTTGDKSEPISMGIIVDFTNRTVQGFGFPDYSHDFPVKITGMNEVTVAFHGSNEAGKGPISPDMSITGSIDRVTGDVEARSATSSDTSLTILRYALKCRPTQRMF
jgi:hypothetical protein